ncbi:hypothetical protein DS745_20845 [Anaerobacillus alkaliphilus]|uniref:Thioredoxin domain-containing protein n=1 Tax=Anaerobacillus alkaliphilus TaxID=1548597 RepID=A0A4Q0VLW7_9BACI|nr:redoxin domain-containing protein [Anaerobacillus alkaliphilus]RXI96193.1 hypothetical protein DS745_20845 [Anaerobacillus alkaliphilus]
METFLMYFVIILLFTQSFSLFLILLMYRRSRKIAPLPLSQISLGQPLPPLHAFSFTRNKKVTIKRLIKKPTLITFITPNSKPCKNLLDDLQKFNQHYGSEINLITVVFGGEPEGRSLLRKQRVPGELIWDQDKKLFTSFGVKETPFAFAVDENGVVKDKGFCSSINQIEVLTSSFIHYEELQEIIETK